MGTLTQLYQMIKAEADRQLEEWIDTEAVPLSQDIMRGLHYDTGRLTASIRKTAPNTITVGGSEEVGNDGAGEKLVDYAAIVEARYAPVRGAIIPALEGAIGP